MYGWRHYGGQINCNLFIIWYYQTAWQISGKALIQVIKPYECIGNVSERGSETSRRRERSAGLLHSNGKGVVETDVTGQSMRHVGKRKCVDL